MYRYNDAWVDQRVDADPPAAPLVAPLQIFLAVMYQKNVDSLRSLAFLPQLLSETLERSAGAT